MLAPVVALLLILHYCHPPQRGLLTRVLFNFLHVPVFGLIAVSLYAVIPADFRQFKHAVFAFIATCVLAVLSEVAQIQTARDASFEDLIADCLGAVSFLFAAVAFSPSASIPEHRGMPRRRGC